MSQHTNDEQRRGVKDLLTALTPDEVFAVSLEALRRWWRSRQDGSDAFQLHGDFGRMFVLVVGERKQLTVDAQSWKEPFLYDRREPWMGDVLEFLWWLERAGFAVPLLHGTKDTGGYPIWMRVTRAGARLLAAQSEDSLLPASIERLRHRCPGLPDEVLAHLVDARACLDHALARPSVVLLGLAYETAIEYAVDALVAGTRIPIGTERQKAARRIAAVRGMLVSWPDSESKFGAISAWDFADVLRRRRNDGSHSRPAWDFSDLAEIHELFVSALRHLPSLWSIVALPDPSR